MDEIYADPNKDNQENQKILIVADHIKKIYKKVNSILAFFCKRNKKN